MIEFGWMVVAILIGGMLCFTAYVSIPRSPSTTPDQLKALGARLDQFEARLVGVQTVVAQSHGSEAIAAEFQELSDRLEKIEKAGTPDGALVALVDRVNAITTDMLELKTLVMVIRDQVAELRTRIALRAVAGAK